MRLSTQTETRHEPARGGIDAGGTHHYDDECLCDAVATLAQLAERGIRNSEVPSSILGGGSSESSNDSRPPSRRNAIGQADGLDVTQKMNRLALRRLNVTPAIAEGDETLHRFVIVDQAGLERHGRKTFPAADFAARAAIDCSPAIHRPESQGRTSCRTQRPVALRLMQIC